MVKLEKHIKKFTAAALAGMMALALFTPGALAESDAEPQDPEAALLSDEESATEASYSVKLAAWADDADFDPDGTDSSLYHTGKSFCVDVVVSGDPFSAFQGNVVYDSDRLIYDADKTNAYLEENSGGSDLVTVEATGDGKISIIRTGKVTSSPNTVVATLYFTAKKDKRSTIDMSDVRVGLGTGDGSSVALTEDSITPCVVDVTKSYMMTDIVYDGDVNVDASGNVNVDIDGSLAVDVISMGRDIECAELTVSYDTKKLEFDSDKTEASKAEGCTVSETASGKIMIIRNSSGIKAGNSIVRLYFKATAPGTASIDIANAKAGNSEAQTAYDAEDLAGCSIKVNAPEPEGVAVNVTSYLGDGAELGGVAAGENTLKGEFTFTVKSATTPVAAYTTDEGKTYTKIASVKEEGGVYSFTATAAEGMKIEIALLGDVNLDSRISVADLNVIRDHLLKRVNLGGINAILADVNNDNRLSVADINSIRDYLLKRIESL